MDLNVKDLDDAVGRRLRGQAAAAGMSVQQYLRTELARIAAPFTGGTGVWSRTDEPL